MWYGTGVYWVFIFSMLAWLAIASYSIYEYIDAWINDGKVEKPFLAKMGLINWTGWADGNDVGFALFVGLIVAAVSPVVWPITVPVSISLAIIYYIRHEKRKEGGVTK